VAHLFYVLGRELADKGPFVEIAVAGAATTVQLFDWAAVDGPTDLHVQEVPFDGILGPLSAEVAGRLDIAEAWLEDAVGLTRAPSDQDALFGA